MSERTIRANLEKLTKYMIQHDLFEEPAFDHDPLEYTYPPNTYDGAWIYSPVYSPAITTGWLCPRCNKVNSPHVPSCDCSVAEITVTSNLDD